MPAPDPDCARPGEFGFAFDRSGYRVPAIMVSPWVPEGSVFNDEYRHTSLIATLRKQWGLGAPLSQRDAAARTFDDVFTLETPRDPGSWADLAARPVPAWTLDEEQVSKGLGMLGKLMGRGIVDKAKELEAMFPAELDDPGGELPPNHLVRLVRAVAWHFFPLLTAGQPPAT